MNNLQTVIRRDNELTRFKHFVLENPNESIETLVDQFEFQRFNAEKARQQLVIIGREARRRPHNVPPKS